MTSIVFPSLIIGIIAITSVPKLESFAKQHKPIYNISSVEWLYKQFMEKYHKDNLHEDRLPYFRTSIFEINKINMTPRLSWTADINQFVDLSEDEYRNMMFEQQHLPLYLVDTKRILYDDGPIYDLDKSPKLFDKYMTYFNRTYPSNDETWVRYRIFLSNLKFINISNNEVSLYNEVAGLNEYTDKTNGEIPYYGYD